MCDLPDDPLKLWRWKEKRKKEISLLPSLKSRPPSQRQLLWKMRCSSQTTNETHWIMQTNRQSRSSTEEPDPDPRLKMLVLKMMVLVNQVNNFLSSVQLLMYRLIANGDSDDSSDGYQPGQNGDPSDEEVSEEEEEQGNKSQKKKKKQRGDTCCVIEGICTVPSQDLVKGKHKLVERSPSAE